MVQLQRTAPRRDSGVSANRNLRRWQTEGTGRPDHRGAEQPGPHDDDPGLSYCINDERPSRGNPSTKPRMYPQASRRSHSASRRAGSGAATVR